VGAAGQCGLGGGGEQRMEWFRVGRWCGWRAVRECGGVVGDGVARRLPAALAGGVCQAEFALREECCYTSSVRPSRFERGRGRVGSRPINQASVSQPQAQPNRRPCGSHPRQHIHRVDECARDTAIQVGQASDLQKRRFRWATVIVVGSNK
jgi:hypothetical protein